MLLFAVLCQVATSLTAVGPHVHLDVAKGGPASLLHESPDVAVIEDVLTNKECRSLIAAAESKGLSQSPVAYAGWTEDVSELVKLFASGPGIWLGLSSVLVAHNFFDWNDRGQLAALAAFAWALATSMSALASIAFARRREESLQRLRTSESVVLKGENEAEYKIFDRLCSLLPECHPSRFEALTIIRYKPGQLLAPHFDANRAPDEDKDRGGQTLATLLVYLNDVSGGGETRFNRLGLDLAPKAGEACLFFPADRDGQFDERLEHEGRQVSEEKWIARVWVHQHPIRRDHVAGLADHTLSRITQR